MPKTYRGREGLGNRHGVRISNGYLAELAKEVFSIERIKPLFSAAREKLLHQLNYTNITLLQGDGTLGCKEQAPFDRIIVTAATSSNGLILTEQLKTGGRMVVPLGEEYSQVLTVIEKLKDGVKKEIVCDCVFVPLIGKYGMKQTSESH